MVLVNTPTMKRYIARDLDGSLYSFGSEPVALDGFFSPSDGEDYTKLDDTEYPDLNWYNSPIEVEEDEPLDFVSDSVFGHLDTLKKLINKEVRKAYAEGYEAGLAAAKR